MEYEVNYFTNLVKIIKWDDIELVEDSIKKSKNINDYITTLNIDKRKIAVGMDFTIWYFDVFSEESHFWNTNPAYFYAAAAHEFSFLTANPRTSLMTIPAFNTGLARLMGKKSKMTLLNNYQLNFFEKFIKDETWDYETVTMQEIESETGRKYDFISMCLHDVLHNPESVIHFFNMLNSGGTLMMLYTGLDNLYTDESIYTEIYELHQILKNIPSSIVYHNPTGAAITYVIKDGTIEL